MVWWLHPLVQALATLLALWVLEMGIKRYLFAHRKIKCFFNWKRHVLWGKVALFVWAVGLALGLQTTHTLWGGAGHMGAHFYVAMAMLPMLAFGYVSGQRLDAIKKKRAFLPLLHGISNLVLTLLALYQAYTGFFFMPL